jgi:hypothetical protein
MTTRTATCSCGQLRVEVEGDPRRVSICHCFECQRRTGSVFGAQARFDSSQVVAFTGRSSRFERVGDAGSRATFHFCPDCGATVHWENDAMPGSVAVAVGAFADPGFPAPTFSVYEARRHEWAMPAIHLEHMD